MDEQPDDVQKRSFTYAIAVVILLVLYALSIGPVTWLSGNGLVPNCIEDEIFACYDPVWDIGTSDMFYPAFSRYMKFWYSIGCVTEVSR